MPSCVYPWLENPARKNYLLNFFPKRTTGEQWNDFIVNVPNNISGRRRLTTLHRYQILDSVSERTFDDIVKLASHFFEVPIAAILHVENDQHLLKTAVGVRGAESFLLNTNKFCVETMAEPDVLVVEDTICDERFAHNPLVTSGPQVRFYAGAPLAMPDGLGLGALCVMDTKPRRVGRREKEMLQSLARMVMTTMDLHRVSEALASEVLKVKNLSGLLPICSGCKNIRNDGGYWQRVESYVSENSSAEFTHGLCPGCAKKYFPGFSAADMAEALQ